VSRLGRFVLLVGREKLKLFLLKLLLACSDVLGRPFDASPLVERG
jgi:hypothetical protein